jgi:hypothetical protein
MQSKDILKSNTPTTTWAVTKGGWVSKSDKSSGKVSKRYCTPVTIIDPENQYYVTQVYSATSDQREWAVAPSSERTKGFLVEDGAQNRWVVKSADFIGLWADKEKEWSAQESEAEKVEQERQRRHKLQSGEDARIKAVNESIERDLTRSLSDLLTGARGIMVSLGVEGIWNEDYTAYQAKTSGRVTIDVKDFQRLLEAVYEAREAVN